MYWDFTFKHERNMGILLFMLGMFPRSDYTHTHPPRPPPTHTHTQRQLMYTVEHSFLGYKLSHPTTLVVYVRYLSCLPPPGPKTQPFSASSVLFFTPSQNTFKSYLYVLILAPNLKPAKCLIYSLLRRVTVKVLPLSSYKLYPTKLPLLETFLEILFWNICVIVNFFFFLDVFNILKLSSL
jgi:hypothetical protein